MAIRPTFYGFEMARSALFASQRSIDVTGQNIANINTVGYSRQRANLSAVGAGGLNWKYALQPAENVGLGVNVDGIQRIRDEFLDVRFRKEETDNEAYFVKEDGLGSLEMLLDEFFVENVHSILTKFAANLQDLSLNADEVEMASLVRSSSETLTRTLNKISKDIDAIRADQFAQITLVKDTVNKLAQELNDINKEVINETLLGSVSNELLDQRDLALDKLAAYGNVTSYAQENGGINVHFGQLDDSGGDASLLVYGGPDEELHYYTLDFEFDPNDPYDEVNPVRLIWGEDSPNAGNDFVTPSGQIKAFYELLNGVGDISYTDDFVDQSSKGIPYFTNILDYFTEMFADEFNRINDRGDLFMTSDGGDFKARNITISEAWNQDPSFILRATDENLTEGAARNDNVLRMIDALKRTDREMPDGYVGSFAQYIGSLNSEIMIEVNYNTKLRTMSDGILLAIANYRSSIMDVSEDEEAMNLAKFQKSYNAAARFMTTLDEMVETIVLRMGIVGR
ncbi:flagellar hook-associated protein FlgK [Clostridia bacterium]|nr:flagellar hook-associated protein FlgK [Clostridia bacterium]